jgi:hypothetical protein
MQVSGCSSSHFFSWRASTEGRRERGDGWRTIAGLVCGFCIPFHVGHQLRPQVSILAADVDVILGGFQDPKGAVGAALNVDPHFESHLKCWALGALS